MESSLVRRRSRRKEAHGPSLAPNLPARRGKQNMIIICFFRKLYRNIEGLIAGTAFIGSWSGCNYKDELVVKNATVTVSKCEDCGAHDISWKR